MKHPGMAVALMAAGTLGAGLLALYIIVQGTRVAVRFATPVTKWGLIAVVGFEVLDFILTPPKKNRKRA